MKDNKMADNKHGIQTCLRELFILILDLIFILLCTTIAFFNNLTLLPRLNKIKVELPPHLCDIFNGDFLLLWCCLCILIDLSL
jgi:hypothetical protein